MCFAQDVVHESQLCGPLETAEADRHLRYAKAFDVRVLRRLKSNLKAKAAEVLRIVLQFSELVLCPRRIVRSCTATQIL